MSNIGPKRLNHNHIHDIQRLSTETKQYLLKIKNNNQKQKTFNSQFKNAFGNRYKNGVTELLNTANSFLKNTQQPKSSNAETSTNGLSRQTSNQLSSSSESGKQQPVAPNPFSLENNNP